MFFGPFQYDNPYHPSYNSHNYCPKYMVTSISYPRPLPWDKEKFLPTVDKKERYRINKCEKCGHNVPSYENLIGKHCPECGHKHPSYIEYIEKMKQPRCPGCESERQTGTYCMDCGYKIKKKVEK